MTARHASIADLDECLRMGRAFTKAAGLEADDESMATTLLKLIEDGGLFVAGDPIVGMAGALVYQNYFNLNTLAAQEVFWWVDPNARRHGTGIELLLEVESWAKAKGAKTLTMVALDALDVERVAGMYMSAGYKPQERNFVRSL
jgi:GNAT superfamily N-acetyltransferase